MKKQLLLVLGLFYLVSQGFSQSANCQEQFWTLAKVYGVIKYYNNEKDDSYLDEETVKLFPLIGDSEYTYEDFNADLISLFPKGQRFIFSDSKLTNPFDQFNGTDHKNIVDFLWIDEDKILSEDNKKLLQQLIYSQKSIKNSNIKKKKIFIHEEKYLPDSITDSDKYLLALIKFWNVIEYFFPYKPVMDEDWDKVFYKNIREFSSIKNEDEYTLMLKKLSAQLNDSHVYVEDERINDTDVYKLPFRIEIAEGQLVIVGINDSLSNLYNIKNGDAIEDFEGNNYERLWKEFSEISSYSTPQAGRDYFKIYLFHRYNYNDSSVEATVKTEEGYRTIEFSTITLQDFIKLRNKKIQKEPYQDINEQIGYLYFPDMGYFELGKALRKVKKTKYLILDFRGHNYGFSSLRLLNFVGNRNIPIAKYYQPNLSNPGIFNDPKQVKLKILPKLRTTYKGKIIVLIDEKPVSAMESLLMAIKARRSEAVFIGSPTQGTDGEMSLMVLPSERKIWFTGVDWSYPDGSQFQRIGIQPDIFVERTVDSIKKGEDPVLNKALELIQKEIE